MAEPVRLRRVAPGDVKALNLSPVDDVTLAQAGAIMKDVRAGGQERLIEIAQKYGDIKPGELTQSSGAGTRVGARVVTVDSRGTLQRAPLASAHLRALVDDAHAARHSPPAHAHTPQASRTCWTAPRWRPCTTACPR